MSSGVKFEMISRDASWRVFDDAAQRLLRMSGEEVARRWDAGDFAGTDSVALMQVIMLRPSGR
jgi:hypothetical protein